MKYTNPIIEILRFDEAEILTLSTQNYSQHQEAQYILGKDVTKDGKGTVIGIDVRDIGITIK